MAGLQNTFGAPEPEAAGLDQQRLTMIGDAMQREIDGGRLPGAVLAVARRGKLAYYQAFGEQNPHTRTAMPLDAVFSIASMTKAMTSVAIMQLFEQGQLLLGDPVSAFIPEMAALKRGVLDVDGRLQRIAIERPPTIQDLLRHTSGLTYQGRGTSALYAAYPGSSTSAAIKLSKQQTIEALASCPLLFEPGAAWEYGFSTDVLGFVVEAITGQTLGQYLAEKVWGPIGMVDTAFDLTEASAGRHAKAFTADPLTGEPQKLYHDNPATKHWESGGGGAVSTALDYLAFTEMLRRGGTFNGARVLGPKTVRLMTCDHLDKGTVNRIADTMDPAAEGYGFGLGFAVRQADGVAALAGTAGDYYWSGVYGTYFWVDPAEELSCVLMAAAPGTIRLRFRQLSRALVYQSIS